MAKTKLRLNIEQKKAVGHGKGPIIVIAGAGTGKTRVITERIVRLLKQKKVKAEEILAVTFTEKAAGEMLDRVDRAMPYGYGDLWILTFHGLCDRILKERAVHIGMNPGYELMTYPMQVAFLRKHLFKEFKLEYFRPLNNPYRFIDALIKHVSRLQDEDVSPKEYLKFAEQKAKSAKKKEEKLEAKKVGELAKFYKKYQKLKRDNNKVDFGDLIYYTLELFRKRPNVLKEYQDRFKYILVDEFQDTNFTQNEIALKLAEPENNIMVVGDDDQAIYRFRGASISNILQFKERFPKAKEAVLTKNYRSVQEILDGAYKVIQNNNPYRLEEKAKVDKKLRSEIPEAKSQSKSQKTLQMFESKSAVETYRFQREFDEADFIAQKVMEAAGFKYSDKTEKVTRKKGGLPFEEIAVLARAHAHLSPVVDRLRFYGVPFQFVGIADLFSRPVVKDMMALLRVISDAEDNLSVYRVLGFDCFEIDPQGLNKLTNESRYSGDTLWSVSSEVVMKSDTEEAKDKGIEHQSWYGSYGRKTGGSRVFLAKNTRKHTSQRGFKRLRAYFSSVDKVCENIAHKRGITSELFNLLKQIDYISVLEKQKPDQSAFASLYEFLNLIKQYENETAASLPELLDYLDNIESLGGIDQKEVDYVPTKGVQLLTVHASKGLEFDTVIVPSLVRDRFPSRAMPDPIPIPDEMVKEILPEDDVKTQEERRLFYVAMTRAKNRLVLTFSDYYSEGKQLRPPSVFLTELVGENIRSLKYGKPADALGVEPKVKADKEETVRPRLARVSFSQLTAYKRCPKQYYFRYVIGLYAPPSAVLSFGNTVHNALKKFFELQQEYVLAVSAGKKGLPAGKKAKPPSLDDLLKFYKESWIGAGYRNKRYEERRKKSGVQALTKFYKKLFDSNLKPLKLEEGFRAQIGGVTVVGKIDRVDLTKVSSKNAKSEVHKVKLIDYKTGADRDEIDANEKLQLAIYAMAVKARWGWQPTQLAIIRVEGGREICMDFSEKLLDKAEKFVENTVEQIGTRGFPARPGYLCKYCDYRKICNWAK